jgi:DNA replication licensing factor MCM4
MIDMDVLATGRTQASRVMIQKLIPILKDMVKANLNDFRGNGMRFTDIINKVGYPSIFKA